MFTLDHCEPGRTIVQFRDDSILITNAGGGTGGYERKELLNQVRKKTYGGKMTYGARKRMMRALTLMSHAVPQKWKTNPVTGRIQLHKLSFITLTISDRKNIDAKTAYTKLLKPFLHWLRYSVGVRHYVWKLELQQRGQIHYHLIVPAIIHYRKLRDKWNQLQRDNGLLRGYTQRTKKVDPNSTDIFSVNESMTKNMVRYMLKYLLKGLKKTEDATQDETQPDEIVNGKVWDCAESLNEKYFTVMYTDRAGIALQEYVNENKKSVASYERFMIVRIDFKQPPEFLRPTLERYRYYLQYIQAGGIAFAKNLV